MTSISTHEPAAGTATIYQFPVGGRAGLTASHDAVAAVRPVGSDVALTDAWYHQEAIREAQQATKQ